MNQPLDCRHCAYEERTRRRSPTGNGRCKDRPGHGRESPDAPAVVHAAKEPLGLRRFPGAPLSRRLHDFCGGGMIGDGGAPRLQQSEDGGDQGRPDGATFAICRNFQGVYFHAAHFLGVLCRLVFGHSTPEIRGGKTPTAAVCVALRYSDIAPFLLGVVSFPSARGRGGLSSGSRRSLSRRRRPGYQVC